MMMDIGASYPTAAGIEKWQRSVKLNRGKNVAIEDVVQLKTGEPVIQHLMTCYAVEMDKPGILVIHQPSKDFYLHYPSAKFIATIEKVPMEAMEDQGVKQKWGENIYRINLKAVNPVTKEHYVFSVTTK
jgi:hypothetical protein